MLLIDILSYSYIVFCCHSVFLCRNATYTCYILSIYLSAENQWGSI